MLQHVESSRCLLAVLPYLVPTQVSVSLPTDLTVSGHGGLPQRPGHAAREARRHEPCLESAQMRFSAVEAGCVTRQSGLKFLGHFPVNRLFASYQNVIRVV